MRKKQISKESELRFAAEFVRKGYNVFLPVAEDSPIDFVVYKDRKFGRVQIKATKITKGALSIKLASSNSSRVKKYSSLDVDFIGVYDYENKVGYLLKLKDVEDRTLIRLRIHPPKNNQKQKINNAEDYLFFK